MFNLNFNLNFNQTYINTKLTTTKNTFYKIIFFKPITKKTTTVDTPPPPTVLLTYPEYRIEDINKRTPILISFTASRESERQVTFMGLYVEFNIYRGKTI